MGGELTRRGQRGGWRINQARATRWVENEPGEGNEADGELTRRGQRGGWRINQARATRWVEN